MLNNHKLKFLIALMVMFAVGYVCSSNKDDKKEDKKEDTKKDEQTTLLTTLNALVEANNALVQMMSQLIGAMNSGAPALRIIPIASVSTAVTGSVTATVSSLTNFGTGIPAKEMADDINNMTVDLCNINNITF